VLSINSLYAGNSVVLIGLEVSDGTLYNLIMQSENPFGADNQQERSKEYQRGYIVGLVDGEGSFHIAFAKRNDLPLGISVIPEFHISQNEESKIVLRIAQRILGCGYIKPNHRKSKDKTFVYVVRDRTDLLTKVIPFFEYNKLLTTKREDFQIFAQVVRLLALGENKTFSQIVQIINLAYRMNGGGKRRIITKESLIRNLKSSETIREIANASDKI
jgi:hypothetical protein